jgi:hypothetical protein
MATITQKDYIAYSLKYPEEWRNYKEKYRSTAQFANSIMKKCDNLTNELIKKLNGCRLVCSTQIKHIKLYLKVTRQKEHEKINYIVNTWMFKEAKERYLQYCSRIGGLEAYNIFKREFKIQLEFERNYDLFDSWKKWGRKKLDLINEEIDNKVRAYKAELQILKQELESIEFPHELTQVEKLEKLKQELETIPRNPYEELFQEFSKYETL